ncbi:hypothetical protein GPECTOR_306g836 [Gonium pectorale]|uniref:Uncharacterized protein n=1 Tax=Gonium pectorale TaxID=33097 RepID=A0A150FVT5_GONPE|nr:hypothetical protein GPECTOR_306g836 [Gonium pectorale]|eukprot:KXZ41721.1 hypothetical protein GPECTOR_306g836 [Gonium pectorale]
MLKVFKKPDVKEQVRESQRELRKGTRDIDREVLALRREEEKLVREIKAAAKAGNTPGARALAKSLVRLRGQVAKLQGSSAQLRGVGAQMTTAAATATVAKAMGSATKTMTAMQTALDPKRVAASAAAFSRENAKMEMAGEVMGDALDGALGDEDLEDETGELVGQVLDEIGIDLAASMQSAPRQRQRVAAPSAAAADEEPDDELMARLANLKS